MKNSKTFFLFVCLLGAFTFVKAQQVQTLPVNQKTTVAKTATYSDKETLAAERAKNSSGVHAVRPANHQTLQQPTAVATQPAKEVHYGPTVTHTPVQKPTTGSNTFIKHPEVPKAKSATPKSSRAK